MPAANSRKRRAQKPGSRVAAFFDLDRTLLGDSSGLLLMEALEEKGLVSSRDRTIADLTRRFYRTVGETWIGMQITRRSIGRFAGWAVADLRDAARRALDRMDAAVYDEARSVIDRHHKAGDLVVIATSTGRDIVEPLAERLGADELIATEYEHDGGILTGNFVGKWLWGPDKAEAIEQFARDRNIDLDESYAYSDSYYDRHLLSLVGHPRPVNADPMLRALAARRGWPVSSFGNHPDGARRTPDVLDFLLPLSNIPFLLPVSVRVENLDAIPRHGPVLVAANHRSYLDPVVLTWLGARRGRKLRYLGKKEVFDTPVVGEVLKALGQIRVDRGSGNAQPLREALAALDQGDAIGIFPQGTIPRGRQFFERVLRARTGVARLAVASGAPIVPVALWDTEAVWPRSHRIPRIEKLATRATVHARAGEPFTLRADADDGDTMRALAQDVMDRVSALLPDEVRHPPAPTPDQIRLASPANSETR